MTSVRVTLTALANEIEASAGDEARREVDMIAGMPAFERGYVVVAARPLVAPGHEAPEPAEVVRRDAWAELSSWTG